MAWHALDGVAISDAGSAQPGLAGLSVEVVEWCVFQAEVSRAADKKDLII